MSLKCRRHQCIEIDALHGKSQIYILFLCIRRTRLFTLGPTLWRFLFPSFFLFLPLGFLLPFTFISYFSHFLCQYASNSHFFWTTPFLRFMLWNKIKYIYLYALLMFCHSHLINCVFIYPHFVSCGMIDKPQIKRIFQAKWIGVPSSSCAASFRDFCFRVFCSCCQSTRAFFNRCLSHSYRAIHNIRWSVK